MDAERRIQEIVEGELKEGFFLVDVIISGSRKSNVAQTAVSKVLVLVDGDNGIDIDTCAEISRKLGQTIEEEELLEGAYRLEVSSPGLDHPLKLRRQYDKNIGRKVKVHLHDGRVKEGKLLKVSDEEMLLKEAIRAKGSKKMAINEVGIPFSNIHKTNVVISFK